MAGDQDDSLRVLRISPAQNRINIGDFRRLGNAIGGRLGESVGPYFEASAAIVRVAVEFAFNPLTCCADPVTRRNGTWILCGKRQPSPQSSPVSQWCPESAAAIFPSKRQLFSDQRAT